MDIFTSQRAALPVLLTHHASKRSSHIGRVRTIGIGIAILWLRGGSAVSFHKTFSLQRGLTHAVQ